MRILIVGFGPFPGAAKNPSGDLARALARRRRTAFAGASIDATVLPTTYAALADTFPALLARHDPDLVLLFGLATRARMLRVETRAVRAASPIHADAKGAMPPRDIFPPGPHSLKVTVPAERLVAAARTAVPARRSHDAGRYLCNAALYNCLATARLGGRPRAVAFVHTPRPRGKFGAAALLRAGEAVLRAMIAHARQG